MTLPIVDKVRDCLKGRGELRESDLVALISLTDQLWAQTQRRFQTSQDRREYMRLYMRRYRAQRRLRALIASQQATD